MESIVSVLQGLNINWNQTISYMKSTTTSIQKCYISKQLFNDMLLKPGKIVLIHLESKSYVCKIYSKALLHEDLIEIDNTVCMLSLTNTYKCENLKELKIVQDPILLKDLQVTLVFESFNTKELWLGKDEDLIRVLKKYILPPFTLADNCQINMLNLPQQQRFGLSKILINYAPNISKLNLQNIVVGKVSSQTKICIVEKITQDHFEQLNSELSPLYALDKIENRLMDVIKLNEEFKNVGAGVCFPPTKQILLVGPSGCGKSSLVRLIAHKTKSFMIDVLGHEIHQSEPGETESSIRRLFEQAFSYAYTTGKCILHLEEVDNLCPQRKGTGSHTQRAVTQLLQLLDKAQVIPGVIVIATTNKPDSIDPSARRYGRLEAEMYIGPPTEKEREIILLNLIKNVQPQICKEFHEHLSSSVANMTPGFVGADLKMVIQKLMWNHHKNNESLSTYCDLDYWKNEFRNVILLMTPSSIKGTLGVVNSFCSSSTELAGIENIKKSLEMTILWPIIHSDAFIRMGIPRPRGVLLYGPPGCAKTSLVRAVASLGTFSLLSITSADLYSPYVGDAERLVAQLFQRARQNSPCILFIDEIDSLVGSRSDTVEKGLDIQERIIASLLTQMDGVGNRSASADTTKQEFKDDGVIVIGATNRPDMVDAALLRPGRFDKHIHVPPPDYSSRIEILKLLTNKMRLAEDVMLEDIAQNTEWYSGADLKNVCTEAALVAMATQGVNVDCVDYKSFSSALSFTRPSLNKTQIQQYHNFRNNKRFHIL